MTLVLNKSWAALTIDTAKESIIKAFTGVANAVDENYIQYNWDEWLERSQSTDKGYFIYTSTKKVEIPKIIVLLKYNKIPKIKVKLTRRNLLIRDNYTCQYTGKKVTMKDATVDHVLPKSRGGKTVWDNVVTACFEINIKKGNKTPEESGLQLSSKPKKPIWSLKYTKHISKIYKIWKKFIDTDQWNEIGYWDVELVD